ncbi:hypothetical protein SEA_DAUBENSKI_91 [Streptomyces phage Daubenski]|uniref:Uncharacterized protein n=1 Tax=Streptomyces phage Daubenski TaxID=2653725 RepID=A0A5Q2WI34_9CAUD|nr:hypothetical protein KNU80_gp175 [Streptomyces phage Daubenski]QGH76534.1 hypothetical protein SEA_DAUBENSKI_91 [Streptomyces phage Daubenski]
MNPRLIIRSFAVQHVAVRRPTQELWRSITLAEHVKREFQGRAVSAPQCSPDITAQISVRAVKRSSAGRNE